MTLFPLDSTLIRAYGWEVGPRRPREARVGLLEIEFHTGDRWLYFNVPEAVFDAFMMARSKGGFFRAHIRDAFQSRRAEEIERRQSGA